MATLPKAQRQGAALALMSQVMQYEMAQGIKEFLVLSTPDGLGLYQRLGFDILDIAQGWLPLRGSSNAASDKCS